MFGYRRVQVINLPKTETLNLLSRLRYNGITLVFVEFIFATILLTPLFIIYGNYNSGDGAIYFSFFKYFFSAPFSNFNGNVTFGATSPLYVPINAIIYAIVGEPHWIIVSKTLNFLFVVIAILLIVKATNSGFMNFCLILLATYLNKIIFVNAAQLFETTFVILFVSYFYFLIKREQYTYALFLSGLLYLIRPELIIITVVINILIFKNIKKPFFLIPLSLLPVLIYHLYMYFHTKEVIPSNIVAKMMRSSESSLNWWDLTWQNLQSVNYFLPILIIIFIFIKGKSSKFKIELFFLMPILVLSTIFPSTDTVRYLLPMYPILLSLLIIIINDNSLIRKFRILLDKKFFYSLIFIFVSSAIMVIFLSNYHSIYHYSYNELDDVLLKDLADQLNPLLKEEENILIYEIQGQYYLRGLCFSLDGIVGNQFHNVLRRKETYDNFILSNKVRYVVTMNSLNYRKVFRNTLMEELYTHDLKSNIGDTLFFKNLQFIKIITNRTFCDPKLHTLKRLKDLNTDSNIRVYTKYKGKFSGLSPFWNSVYLVSPKISVNEHI